VINHVSWPSIKAIAKKLHLGCAAEIIEERLRVFGDTNTLTFDDVKAVADLIGAKQLISVVEQYITMQISAFRIISSTEYTTADKIRQLTQLGLSRSKIAGLLQIRYQQVRNTLMRSVS